MGSLPAATALAFASAFLSVPHARVPQAPGQRDSRVDTQIRARYEEAGRRITGEVTQTWTNATDDRVSDLWFHLYHNAFANDQSTHLVESDGELRGERIKDGWGWQRVTAITSDGADLMPSFRYRHPDDDNVEDRTVFSVELPRPVAPGQSLSVTIQWEAQVPRVRRRTGYKDDFLFLAHWFPKLGVYEGGRGWNCHQFHASTEFYANYGTYDVTLELPAKYEGKVFASGRQVGPAVREGDYVRTHFVAPSPEDQLRVDATGKQPLVHSFTWTADTKYRVRSDTFQFGDWARMHADEVKRAEQIFGPSKDLRLRTVDVTVLIQPEHADQWRRHFEAASAALFFYGLWFGEYPYERVTVVDPAWGAAAGGMEYPTLFTAGTSMFATSRMHTPESVTVHECGHQFWYGLVGNNEFEAAWLDEGFNSYTDSEVLIRHYGERYATTSYSGLPFHGVPLAPAPGGGPLADVLAMHRIPLPDLAVFPSHLAPLRSPASGNGFVDWWRDQPLLSFSEQKTDPRWGDRSGYLSSADRDPIDTFGWRYVDRNSYGVNSYSRPAIALRSLPAAMSAEGADGTAAFLRGMRHHAETWRYRHPYPDDFFASFNEGAGVDMTWYFDQTFRGTGTVDWLVNVTQRRVSERRGFFQGAPGGEFAEVESPIVKDEDEEKADEDDPADQRPWRSQITIERKGELILPLPVRLTFADGTTESLLWTRTEQAERRWLELERTGAKKLASVVLDPDRGYFFDTDMSNNAWFDEADAIAPWRWTERVFTRFAHLLHWQAGLGG